MAVPPGVGRHDSSVVELPGYDQGAELRGLVPLHLRTKNIPVPGDTGIEVPYLDRGHHQTGGPHLAILTELLATVPRMWKGAGPWRRTCSSKVRVPDWR